MKKHVLKYFDSKGLAEPVRLLMSYGNQEFEDVRYESTLHESWPEVKKTTMFGQLPVLYMEGKQYAQSTPLSRYFGRLFGLDGKTPLEDLEIEMNVEFIHDIRNKLYEVQTFPDPVRKEQMREEKKEEFHELFSKLEEIVKNNNGHLALGRLTWGDFSLAGLIGYLRYMARIEDFETKFPNIVQSVKNIESIPEVKKWVDIRPDTPR